MFKTFALGYNHAPPTSTYYCWTISGIWMGLHCRPAGSWMDILTDCCTMYWWCVATLVLWKSWLRMEWCFVVFSYGNWFCLYSSDGCTCIRHRPGEHYLPEWIHPRHIDLTSGFMVWGAISYNSRSHLVFLQGKVNSACYIAQVVNPMLLPLLRQEGDVLISRTMHIHIWLLWCSVLFMMYNSCSG